MNNIMYTTLEMVLRGAYRQASEGKGKERHGDDEPFENQKICVINRWIGDSPVAGALFQAVKKTVESSRLSDSAAIDELRGAINYLAAAIILLEERPEEKPEKEPLHVGTDLFKHHLNQAEEAIDKRKEFTEIQQIFKPAKVADSTPAGERLCVRCYFVGYGVQEMPCKKCIKWDFKPHFRPDEA
jgi:hypothetical protein